MSGTYRIFYDCKTFYYQDVEADSEEEALKLFKEDSEKLSRPKFIDTTLGVDGNIKITLLRNEN